MKCHETKGNLLALLALDLSPGLFCADKLPLYPVLHLCLCMYVYVYSYVNIYTYHTHLYLHMSSFFYHRLQELVVHITFWQAVSKIENNVCTGFEICKIWLLKGGYLTEDIKILEHFMPRVCLSVLVICINAF